MKTRFFLLSTLFFIIVFPFQKGFCQATSSAVVPCPAAIPNTPSACGGDFLGWAAAVVGLQLDIRHNGGLNIDFYRGPAAINQSATILGVNGFFGLGDPALGTNFATFPNYRLDVDFGDININTPGKAYRLKTTILGSKPVLYNNDIMGCINVGLNAGPLNAATRNTFVGESAGLNCTTSGLNTLVGYAAGRDITTSAGENTFVGAMAGMLNTGTLNTFVGDDAGIQMSGSYNTYVGGHGYGGAGDGNIALGYVAGQSPPGDYNILIGVGAQGASGTHNSAAIGQLAQIRQSNQIILGGIDFQNNNEHNVKVGIGLANDNIHLGPRNMLEINAHPTSYTYTGGLSGLGESGLQFRQLTDNSTPGENTGPGILTVDEDGNVVYVQREPGNYCSAAAQNPLIDHYEIPLTDGTNGYDYYFSGQGNNKTGVIIGGVCSVNLYPHAKLQVLQFTTQTNTATLESIGGVFYNSNGNRVGIGALGISDQADDLNIGLKGYARQYSADYNVGVLGTTILNPVLFGRDLNIGTYGYTFRPQPTTTQNHYAVVGDLGVTCPACITGTAAGTGDFAGYFNGDIFTTNGFYQPSDQNLKNNLADIINPMDVLNLLNPKSYTYDQVNNLSMSLPKGTHFGFTAQNIESVLPTAVKDIIHPARFDSTGNEIFPEIAFKGVNNLEVIPFLVAAIKEQQQTIEAMQSELMSLSGGGNRYANPENEEQQNGSESQERNSIDVQLANVKSLILNQNVPNPFAEQTTISYFITDEVRKAQIFFYDNKGIIMKVVDINDKGAGQLNVFAEDLSSGNYTYTLIADGRLIETKKMIKQ